MFAFKTAKHWGTGPRDWTAQHLNVDSGSAMLTSFSPATPGTSYPSPMAVDRPSPELNRQKQFRPSMLCRWSVHLPDYDEPIEAPPLQTESAASQWPSEWQTPDYLDRLRNGLESNDFSDSKIENLPVAIPQVLAHCERRREDLLLDSFAFGVMSRNLDLLRSLRDDIELNDVDVGGLYPFHLSIAYLMGSNACCNVLSSLRFKVPGLNLRKVYVDDHGYTVLDSMMLTILKSHTRAKLGDVDVNRRHENRFPGEEISICGRWDADSDFLRTFWATGKSSIPWHWKHKFCHTSAQAICHCIGVLFDRFMSHELTKTLSGLFLTQRFTSCELINTPSGLFLTRCAGPDCGLKLELMPLHVLTMVTYRLAGMGHSDEDLFGAIACLLCILANGIDSRRKANVSLNFLFGEETGSDCEHESLFASELANYITTRYSGSWPRCTRIGWEIFCYVLELSEKTWSSFDSLETYLLRD